MSKKQLVIVIGLLLPITFQAQDLIFRKKQTAIEAEIVKWSQDLVRYRPHDQKDTILHVLTTLYIDSIIFANGETIRFEKKASLPEGYREITSKNFVGIGLADPFIYNNLRFTYERYLKRGKVSLFFPLSIGLTKNSNFYNETATSIHAGAGINFHIPAKRISRFYNIGLGLRVGQYRGIEGWLVGTPRPPLNRYYYLGLINYHSIYIPIRRVILVPGVDFHLLGIYEGNFTIAPFDYDVWPVFRMDVVYHF